MSPRMGHGSCAGWRVFETAEDHGDDVLHACTGEAGRPRQSACQEVAAHRGRSFLAGSSEKVPRQRSFQPLLKPIQDLNSLRLRSSAARGAACLSVHARTRADPGLPYSHAPKGASKHVKELGGQHIVDEASSSFLVRESPRKPSVSRLVAAAQNSSCMPASFEGDTPA